MDSADVSWVEVRYLEVEQPIGRYYVGIIDHLDLIAISYSDIRRINQEAREVETYLGIERPLQKARVGELKDYVNTVDATFPSAIILAVTEEDTGIDRDQGVLYIRRNEQVAKILDGQHRIAGLEGFQGDTFQVIVTIFVEMDIEYQAAVFATINLEQTKVNKSLAYELYAYATTRSPQKTGHNIVRLLNERPGSPFQDKIKILGVAGDKTETISQALFIDMLLPLISENPNRDRVTLRRGKSLQKATTGKSQTLIFRNMFVDERDGNIARLLWNYFSAVEVKWGKYWREVTSGVVLNRTTGFRGLMQFLPYAYTSFARPEGIPDKEQFDEIFARVTIEGQDINPENYPPGTSGPARLRDRLKAQTGLE